MLNLDPKPPNPKPSNPTPSPQMIWPTLKIDELMCVPASMDPRRGVVNSVLKENVKNFESRIRIKLAHAVAVGVASPRPK